MHIYAYVGLRGTISTTCLRYASISIRELILTMRLKAILITTGLLLGFTLRLKMHNSVSASHVVLDLQKVNLPISLNIIFTIFAYRYLEILVSTSELLWINSEGSVLSMYKIL